MKRCDCHTGTILCAECGGVVAVARRRPKKKIAPGKSKADRKAERNERAAKIREEVFDLWGGSCALCVNGTTLSTTMAATDLHHLISGSGNRRAQESVRTTLPVCGEHHRLLHRGDLDTLREALEIAEDPECDISDAAANALQRRIDKVLEARAQHPEHERTA